MSSSSSLSSFPMLILFLFNQYSFRLQVIILFIVNMTGIVSFNNDYQQHQILKVDLGQDVIMSCLFDEDKIDQVSFMRQMTGDILSLGSELFVHQLSSNQQIQLKKITSNRLDLKLLSVQQNDSGIYTCMVNDEKLISYFLQVLVPPRFLSYHPIEASSSYPEGSSLNLNCQTFAVPTANITWIYRKESKQMKVLHQGENISINSLEYSDSGSYECISNNNYHSSINRIFYINVQYSPRIKIIDDQILIDLHETVISQCQVCSNPSVTNINWFRNEQSISDLNINFKIEKSISNFIDDNHQFCLQSTIEILNINEFQFGQYQCQAENILGSTTATLFIKQISRIFKIKQKTTTLKFENHQNLNKTSFNEIQLRFKENRTNNLKLFSSRIDPSSVSFSSSVSSLSIVELKFLIYFYLLLNLMKFP